MAEIFQTCWLRSSNVAIMAMLGTTEELIVWYVVNPKNMWIETRHAVRGTGESACSAWGTTEEWIVWYLVNRKICELKVDMQFEALLKSELCGI